MLYFDKIHFILLYCVSTYNSRLSSESDYESFTRISPLRSLGDLKASQLTSPATPATPQGYTVCVDDEVTINLGDKSKLGNSVISAAANLQYSSLSLIRPPYLPRNCRHIREVAFGEREK